VLLALSAVVPVLWCAPLILCPLAAWCVLPLGVSSFVIMVALAAVGETLSLMVGMSALLAVIETGVYVLLNSLKVSVAVTLAILLCVTTLSSAVWGSPTVTLTERGRAAVVPLRVKRLQVVWVSH
jgi:hypothetical protein